MPYTISQSFPVQPLNHLCIAHNVFTEEQLEQIVFLEELQQFQDATVGTKKVSDKIPDAMANRTDEGYRKSKISWLYPDQNSSFLFHRFAEVLQQVNLDHFRRDIHGFDNIQYTIYEEGGHYNWHWDYESLNTRYIRKISATILLSDPSEYEGGELEIINLGSPEPEKILSLKPNKGDAVFFASWMPHRVKPITKGVRRSLVIWVMGEDRG